MDLILRADSMTRSTTMSFGSKDDAGKLLTAVLLHRIEFLALRQIKFEDWNNVLVAIFVYFSRMCEKRMEG